MFYPDPHIHSMAIPSRTASISTINAICHILKINKERLRLSKYFQTNPQTVNQILFLADSRPKFSVEDLQHFQEEITGNCFSSMLCCI